MFLLFLELLANVVRLHVHCSCTSLFQKSHEETDKLRAEISDRDDQIKGLQKLIDKLQQDLSLSKHTNESSQARLAEAREESSVSDVMINNVVNAVH